MHSQTVEVAAFAHNVAAESLAMLLWGIELAAADADVVADGHRQRIHYVGLLGTALLEDLGQQIEEHLPERRVYGVQPAVEATLGDRLLEDRKSTRLNSSHANISYAVFCLKKKTINHKPYFITPSH